MYVNIGEYPDNSEDQREITVRVDCWDTWSLDYTLALIILPTLKRFRDEKMGVPSKIFIDYGIKQDFPEWNEEADKEFAYAEEVWQAVIDKMIFSFETIIKHNNDAAYEYDERVEDRIDEGLKLFGKYFRALWT